MRKTSKNSKEIFTAKSAHGEKYGEMSHGEKVVGEMSHSEMSSRRSVLTAKCPYGELSYGEVSYGGKSYGQKSGSPPDRRLHPTHQQFVM